MAEREHAAAARARKPSAAPHGADDAPVTECGHATTAPGGADDLSSFEPAGDEGAAAACWHLYLLRRADGAIYTGISTDVERRIAEHTRGGPRAARSLRARGPLSLVYRAMIGAHGTALRAEQRVKALARHDKETIVRLQPDARALLARLGLDGAGREYR